MRSPFIALIWEIWRQSYRLIWLVIGTVLLCALINHLVPDKPYLLDRFQAVYWLLMVFSLFVTFGIFHYAEYNPRKSWHGFPYRLFSLPVPTVILVTCPMVLGVVSVELVYWAWAKLVFAPIGRAVSFWPAACVGVGVICYQAIVWSLAGFRITRIIALAVAGLLLADLGMMPLLRELSVWPDDRVLFISILLLSVFAGLAFFGAWFCVERQRRGGGRGKGWLRATAASVVDGLPRRTRDFSSPAAAQLWFEWRRSGLMLPMSAAFVLLSVVLPLSWFTRHESDSLGLTLGWALLLPLVLSVVIGKGFVKPEFWSTNLSLPPFLATRPFASGELVVTKMKVAALSVAVTWSLVLIFLSCYLPLWAPANDLREGWKSLLHIYRSSELCAIIVFAFLVGMILTWRFLVQSLWIGLAGSQKLFVASALMQVFTAACLVWGSVWMQHLIWTHLNQAMHNLRWIGWVLVAVAVVKLSLSLFSWNPISPGRVKKYLLLWWVGTFCMVALVFALNPSMTPVKHVLILAAFLPVPLARLGFAPLSLSKNRHR